MVDSQCGCEEEEQQIPDQIQGSLNLYKLTVPLHLLQCNRKSVCNGVPAESGGQVGRDPTNSCRSLLMRCDTCYEMQTGLEEDDPTPYKGQ